MQRDIRPEWLLRLADELGGRGAGCGQPRTTNLRRAVSTAYYALFHCLALSTARSALPDASQEEVFGVARYVSHAAIKQVSSYISGETPPKHLAGIVDSLRKDEVVTSVAGTFLELYEQREDADYNHLADFTRRGVLGLIARARAAVEQVRRHQHGNELRAFFGLVMLRTSIAR